MLAGLLAQFSELASAPTAQLSIQTVGLGGVVWVLGELRRLGRRLARIEHRLKIEPPLE